MMYKKHNWIDCTLFFLAIFLAIQYNHLTTSQNVVAITIFALVNSAITQTPVPFLPTTTITRLERKQAKE